MLTDDETAEQDELEEQLWTATEELQRAVMRLFQDRDIHPHLVVLALAREPAPWMALPHFAWIVMVRWCWGWRAGPHRTGHERTLPHAGLQHRADHARRPGLPPHRRARHETRRPLPGLRAREPGRPQPLPAAPR